jgi:hypothetical protein
MPAQVELVIPTRASHKRIFEVSGWRNSLIDSLASLFFRELQLKCNCKRLLTILFFDKHVHESSGEFEWASGFRECRRVL